MACSFISQSTINQGSRTNTTITAPASIADNDILRIFFWLAAEPGPPPTPTPPTGFSQLLASDTLTGLGGSATGEMKVWVWEKRASSESGDYTVTHGSAFSLAYMEVVRGAVASGSAEDFSVTQNPQTNNSTYTATGGTTTVTGSFVTFFVGAWNTIGATPPPGTTPTYTERYDVTEGYAANGILIPDGATGNETASGASQTATGGSISVLASVKAIAPTAAVTGTVTATITESDIVAGGKTIIVTLTNDTYVSNSTVAPVVQAADCTVSGSNTASAAWLVNHLAASTGDLLVFYVGWDDSTTTTGVTAPAGPNSEVLTSIAGPVTDGNTETRSQAWYTIATGSWSGGGRTFVPSASESWSASMFRVPAGEFDGSSAIGSVSTTTTAGTTDTSVLSPSFSAGANDDGGSLIWCASVDVDPLSATPPTGWSILQQQDLGAVAHGVAIRTSVVAGSEAIASAAWAIAGDSWNSIAFIVRPPTTTPFQNQVQSFIDGLDSAQSEGTGWDAVVKAVLTSTAVARTSDTVLTVTLPAFASYNITAQETITDTVAGSIVTGMVSIAASPTFTIDTSGGVAARPKRLMMLWVG